MGVGEAFHSVVAKAARRMDIRGFLLCLVLGWVSSEEQVTAEGSIWETFSWDHQNEEPLLSLRRPRHRENNEPQLLYAVWDTAPLLVKEGITSEEAVWIPGDQEPLAAIQESYASGSREFDHSFGRSLDVIPNNVLYLEDIPVKRHSKPTTKSTISSSLIKRHSTTPAANIKTTKSPYDTKVKAPKAPYPRHTVHYSPPQHHYSPPRKYYLTGIMEEIKESVPQTHSDVRKYYLSTGSPEINSKPPQTTQSTTEENTIIYETTTPPTSPPSTKPVQVEEKYPTPKPTKQPTYHQRYPTYHHPRGYGHPPAYPPPQPAPYHHNPYPSYHPYPPHYPQPHIPTAPVRKYYLATAPPPVPTHPPTSPPVVVEITETTDNKRSPASEFSSFDAYKKLRQPCMISTAWVSTRFARLL